MMWILSHAGIADNEAADLEARRTISVDLVYGRPPVAQDFLPYAKKIMLQDWQRKWDIEDTGRFTHSIIPSDTLKPWFADRSVERNVVTTISRKISELCALWIESPLETIWDCRRWYVCLFRRPRDHRSRYLDMCALLISAK
jgi:hypothetical protein